MNVLNPYDNSELEANGKKEVSSDEESFHFFQEINKEQNNSKENIFLNNKREHSIDEDKEKNNDIESSVELEKDEISHGKEEENNSEKDTHEVSKKSKKKKKSKSKKNNNSFKSVKSKQVCQFYINGACKKGDKCPYSHDAEQIHKKELCKFFLSGKCLKGDKCLYSHDLSEIPCKFYHGLGFCENFQNCPFSHERLDMEGIKEFIKANEDFLRETKNKYGRTNMDEFYNEYLKEKEGGGDEFIMMPDFIKKEDEEKEKEKENNKDKIPLGILVMSNNNKIINEIKNFYNISNIQKLNNHNYFNFNLNQNTSDNFGIKKINEQNIMFNNIQSNIGRINNNLNKYNQNNTKINPNLNINNYNNLQFNKDKEANKDTPNHRENKDRKKSIDNNNLKQQENTKNEKINIKKILMIYIN